VDNGYEVSAFEPVGAFSGDLWAAGATHVVVASLDDMGSEAFGELAARAPYDAFVLTWGGFAFARGDAARRATLERARELVPEGPLLISYMRGGRGEGRARALGRRAARALGLAGRAEGDQLYPHLGIVHVFDDAEIAALAAETGNVLARPPAGELDYPHVTMRPARRAGSG
jgi:hypothetical protein